MTTPNSVSRYDIGDLIVLPATFVGTDGVTPADPSTIDFLVKNAAGSVATYRFGAAGASIVRTGVGAYFKEIIVEPSGLTGSWAYRAMGTGGIIAAEEWLFIIDRSTFFL